MDFQNKREEFDKLTQTLKVNLTFSIFVFFIRMIFHKIPGLSIHLMIGQFSARISKVFEI